MSYKKPNNYPPKFPQKTNWNEVSSWYDNLIGESGAEGYHGTLIIPKITELITKHKLIKEARILDLACGQGVLTRTLNQLNYKATGLDESGDLIEAARKRSPSIKYLIADAHKLPFNNEFEAIICILALQNMDNLDSVLKEVSKSLVNNGLFIFTIIHPCFRIPRQSGWGWDENRKLQYRRIDSYFSEQKIPIKMNPSKQNSPLTWTFHRPLQKYIEDLSKNNLVVVDLQEWLGNRQSVGAKAKAENRARNEIPLFLTIVSKKQMS